MYLHKPNLETEKATGCWLSSINFFRGGIYCYANFFYYAIVFGPNFRERQKFRGGGGQAVSGHVEESQDEA